ncbi:unnamed protein product [Rhodiola kirilowii]
MLGISYGEWFVILGAAAVMIGPKDLPMISRTLGRLAGRSIGYVQMARGQLDSVMQQTQVHKELQDTMAQLDAIRHEIRSLSMLNPGPMTKSLLEKTLDSTLEADATSGEKQEADKSQPKVPKVADSIDKSSIATNTVSQAAAYARFAEAAAKLKMQSDTEGDKQYDDPGLLSVLPISAESAGLLPKHKGIPHGADILLEAIIEAEVAHNAKDFFHSLKIKSHVKDKSTRSKSYPPLLRVLQAHKPVEMSLMFYVYTCSLWFQLSNAK